MTKRVVCLASAFVAAAHVIALAQSDGAALYDRHCARCHGPDGRPDLPATPDFTRGEGLLKSDQELVNALRFGVGAMPGFEHELTKEEFIDVIFHIRSLQR